MVNFTSILIWATKSLTKQIMDFILQKNQKFIFAHGKILVDKKTLAKKKQGLFSAVNFKLLDCQSHRRKQSIVLGLELKKFYIERKEGIGIHFLVFLRLKVNGFQSTHISAVC